MAFFLDAFKKVMTIEGGYANDPDDPGGETYRGISRKNFPGWLGWSLIDSYKDSPAGLEFMLKTSAKLDGAVQYFYKTTFWDVLKLDLLADQKLATELFDTGVNQGLNLAALFLQQALNLNNANGKLYPDIAEDKVIGPTTLKLANAHPRPKELFKTLNILQGARYIEICKNNPKLEKYFRSWLSRVTTNYDE
jgi:lysozyme family protein